MHFDQRTQEALRDAGLETDDLQAVSQAIVDAADADASALEEFFDANDTVYSDMEMAHSTSAYPEHAVDYLDLTTHADEMRGWLRFDSWGVYVEGGRILPDESVELTLGPTINGRVRFAPDQETLR
ncbi:DUF7532 family protein [Natronorubrum halophilum]|uniref:DUF7532 family protein n=1 Tax=Natronorubrum halophilum TaxID=1702106 RepID=UPI0010C203D5|nr:hypothetical protein [Natronorubrum halophilum]